MLDVPLSSRLVGPLMPEVIEPKDSATRDTDRKGEQENQEEPEHRPVKQLSVRWDLDLKREQALLQQGMAEQKAIDYKPDMEGYRFAPIIQASDKGDYGFFLHSGKRIFVHVKALAMGRNGQIQQGMMVYFDPEMIMSNNIGLSLSKGYDKQTYTETKVQNERQNAIAAREAAAKEQAYRLLSEMGDSAWQLVEEHLPLSLNRNEKIRIFFDGSSAIYALVARNMTEIASVDPQLGITANHKQLIYLEVEVSGQKVMVHRNCEFTTTGWEHVSIQRNDFMSLSNKYDETDGTLDVTHYIGGKQVMMKYPATVEEPVLEGDASGPGQPSIVQYITAETPVGMAYLKRTIAYGQSRAMGYTYANEPLGGFDISHLLIDLHRGDMEARGFDNGMIERIISMELPSYDNVNDIIDDLTRLQPRDASDLEGLVREAQMVRILLHRDNPDTNLGMHNVSTFVPGTRYKVTDENRSYDPGWYSYRTYITLNLAMGPQSHLHSAQVLEDDFLPGVGQYYSKNGSTANFEMTEELCQAAYEYCEQCIAQATKREIDEKRELERRIQVQQQHLLKEFLRLKQEQPGKYREGAMMYHGVVDELIGYHEQLSTALTRLQSLSHVDRYKYDMELGHKLASELDEKIKLITHANWFFRSEMLEDNLLSLRQYADRLKVQVSEDEQIGITEFIAKISSFEGLANRMGLRRNVTLTETKDRGKMQHKHVVLRPDGSIQEPDMTKRANPRESASSDYDIIEPESVIVYLSRRCGAGKNPYRAFSLIVDSRSYSLTEAQIQTIANTYFGINDDTKEDRDPEASIAGKKDTFVNLNDVGIHNRNILVTMLRNLSNEYLTYQNSHAWGKMGLDVIKEDAQPEFYVTTAFYMTHGDPKPADAQGGDAPKHPSETTQAYPHSQGERRDTDTTSQVAKVDIGPSKNDRYLDRIQLYTDTSSEELASLISGELKGDIGMQQVINAILAVRAWENDEVPDYTKDQLSSAVNRLGKVVKDAEREHGVGSPQSRLSKDILDKIEHVFEQANLLPVLDRAYTHPFYREHLGLRPADDEIHRRYRQKIKDRIQTDARENGSCVPDNDTIQKLVEEVVIELI